MPRPLLLLPLLLLSIADNGVRSQELIPQQGGNPHPDIVRREYYVHERPPGRGNAAARAAGPFDGVVPGIFAVLASSWLLWWNEGRSVRDAKMLRRAEEAVVELPVAEEAEGGMIDPANDGKLVHVAGPIETKEGIVDPTFGLRRPDSLRLMRTTESYQWMEERSESRTRVSDTESRVEVTYRYHKGWSARSIDSWRFEAPGGHENPTPSIGLGVETQTVEDATLPNGLSVPPALVNQLGGGGSTGLEVRGVTGNQARRGFTNVRLGNGLGLKSDHADALISSDTLYFSGHESSDLSTVPALEDAAARGGTSGSDIVKPKSGGRIAVARSRPIPQVGDCRVHWKEMRAPPEGVSVLAEQRDGKLVPWTEDGTGHSIYKLVTGRVSARDMITNLREQSKLLTKVLRGLGWFGNFIGWNLILSCLSAIASRIPLGVGRLLEPLVDVATSLVALGASAGVSAAVFAAAWLRFRPLVATGLAAASALGFYGPLFYARWKRRPEVTVIDAKLASDRENYGE